jgi:uncharacterized protein YfaS (alpha-2-macroglobulin family)
VENQRVDTIEAHTSAFSLDFFLPDTINLGQATLELQLKTSGGRVQRCRHTFMVQEFRRPECRVSCSNNSSSQAGEQSPFLVAALQASKNVTFTARAEYLAGGALSQATCRWRVEPSAAHFSPPGWPAFCFSAGGDVAMPYLGGCKDDAESKFVPFCAPTAYFESARTDSAGQHALRVAYMGCPVSPQPLMLTAAATIVDLGGQSIEATSSVLVLPAARCVGLRIHSAWIRKGDPVLVDVVVTDPVGHSLANVQVSLRVVSVFWVAETDPQGLVATVQRKVVTETTLQTRADGEPVLFSWTPEQGGDVQLQATVLDAEGNSCQTAGIYVFERNKILH